MVMLLNNYCNCLFLGGYNEETASFWSCLQEIQDGMEVSTLNSFY
jgi:hypothetical protein